ncbi:rhizobiocin/RTX toxin and hemolysin-type calcium binding protein [Novosphingobium nitrogenifigens DSM 19370]|uniref:Rhizobiocin/RTX toxin and hemolysin-type calcium binding protein n=1 Tax=Novosphingobium nitrogenifigens DSM 19370 TaxID=983920 RepID=F1Z7N2_9SPHN|nr:type I secretion C-terminal target domain-containing protein [Novosphingobium nitrogenifigens]EGD59423.1 rhizobiocin/RTX toxin and hemolysin-type calcium binding protein [Novosphingobium nitrogenifigens DSM 19370]
MTASVSTGKLDVLVGLTFAGNAFAAAGANAITTGVAGYTVTGATVTIGTAVNGYAGISCKVTSVRDLADSLVLSFVVGDSVAGQMTLNVIGFGTEGILLSDYAEAQVAAQAATPSALLGHLFVLGTNVPNDLFQSFPFAQGASYVMPGVVIAPIVGTAGPDVLFGTGGADIIRGYDGADILRGGNGADQLFGGNGADTLYGGWGNDRLYGGSGNDVLYGGENKDTMTGGPGADTFAFRPGDFGGATATKADVITDFSRAQGDRIDLSAIDANPARAGDQAFSFIGASGFTHHAGELRYGVSNGNAVVYGDMNGDGIADFAIMVDHLTRLIASDFIL